MSFVEPGICREILDGFGRAGVRQAVEGAAGGILLGVFLGAPHAAGRAAFPVARPHF